MPQSTNLNVNPYYSDFDDLKNYYKILFKPGTSIQARELNNLQSSLQNQIDKFGSSLYSQGGMVIPGNYAYDNTFNCVEVDDIFAGISVEDYLDEVVGYTFKGKTTNVTAKVDYVLRKSDVESTRNTVCLFVKYQSSSSDDFSTEIFIDGEELVIEEDLLISNTLYPAGSSLFRVLTPETRKATSVGSCAKIESGVYFIRGYFVNVYSSTVILDPYSNTPSYRVGLNVVESIIDSNDDTSLVDNAKGFSNYAAPGADRLKIQATLTKKSLDDFYDDDFIELFRVENGILKKIIKNDPYSFITDILARRTYDESGNYSLNQYTIESLESLNDRLGNNGLYLSDQKTSGGSTPSDDLALLKISPGKSYVKGYEVPTSTTVLDYQKPRETKSVESSSSVFTSGNVLKINNLKSSPKIGLSTNYSVTLYNSRLTSGAVGSAKSIGYARVYDFEYDNTSYENAASKSNLYLFDIQTFTDITLSSSIPGITVSSFVQGNNSGASGYVRTVSGTSLSLYQISGQFQLNESLTVSGISTTSTISSLSDYSINDVKAVSDLSDFTADTVLSKESSITGPFNITVSGSNATIVKSDGTNFASSILVNDIISYSGVGLTVPIFTEVTSINSTKTSVSVKSISNVSLVCSGNVGITTTLQNIKILRPETFNNQNSSLYSELENKNISEISLLNSSVYVKKEYTVTITSNSLTLPDLSNTDFVYSSFDEENYVLIDDSGNNIFLSDDKFNLNTGSKSGTIDNLSVASASAARLIVTLIKSNVTSKYKKLQRCQTVNVTRTKYSTASNGLTTSTVYGTRVEDVDISLNYPDIVQVHGIFESSTNNNATLPSITISGLNTSNIIVGEVAIGKTSGAVAICVSTPSSSVVEFVYKNSNKFVANEYVTFTESNKEATITSVSEGDSNIISEFILDNGQREQFYDIGRLIRKEASKQPSRRLKIVFDYFRFESTDGGDLITVNSYPSELYGSKIPYYDSVRNTDVIDVRPRVSDYSTSSSISPFDYTSRSFNIGSNVSAQILKSNESIVFDYSFYLPRKDKLTLSSDGTFSIVYGKSSTSPVVPKISKEVLDVATISSSAYVFDVSKDIKIDLTDNRRYTMSDLREIEKRIVDLEYYTSLSLLELSTESLLVTDSEGLNRFKSGFFVDNFGSYDTSNLDNESYSALIRNNTLSSPKTTERVDLTVGTLSNLKKTNQSITLDYIEVEYTKQAFASRIINVNPFNIVTWTGKLELSPYTDYWSINISEQENIADFSRRGTSETIVTRNSLPYIRSRNVKFTGTRLKPSTQFDFYFDSRNISSSSTNGNTYAFPKLLEITDVNGVFTVGETVRGYDTNGNTVSFKICSPNHKSGPIDNPTSTYTINPYQTNVGISTLYGTQSTILNVDVDSLQVSSESQYFGNITKGMKVYGSSSNASATISNLRLISDDNGSLVGSFFIPNPESSDIKYRTGNTTAKLTTSVTSSGTPGEVTSSAEATFTSSGQKVITTTIGYYDPLAQSFFVNEDNGIFPTSVDVYFQSKDSSIPVTLQIREVSSGIPGGPDKIVGTLEKVLNASDVKVSSDASVATTFTFDNLTRLEGNREYAIVLLSDSNSYNVWISRVGEVEISTANLPEIQKIIINKQPSLGSLFVSQNGSTWTPTQEDDLKFVIKKAKFSDKVGTCRLFNSTVSTKSLNNRLPKNPITVFSNSGESSYHNGRYILVTYPNHGMYSQNNQVSISGILPDSLPTKLTSNYDNSSTSSINITSGDESNFITFNGVAVSTDDPGYVLIGDEIIKYTGTSTGQLTGITRSQLGTNSVTHKSGSSVYKYEFSGVSLSRINKTFTSIVNPTIDRFYVQIDDDTLFTTTKTGGGDNAYCTKNIQFSKIDFDNNFITNYNNTEVSSSVRTVSSTSVNGTEVSFVDKGFETVGLSSITTFTDPRMICSRENELEYLSDSQFASNKSFTLDINLTTSDTNVSPIINLENSLVSLENNRINKPVSNYITDSRINLDTTEPNEFVYVSKTISLEESSSSLKVLLSAYRHSSSDIRVLYKIFRNDGADNTRNWILFPGYSNIDNNGNIINSSNNDGSSDVKVPESNLNQYRDYTFTADDISPFTSFAIKIIGTSTNQSYSPIIKDLRVIALR
jgi:hypothetical protein